MRRFCLALMLLLLPGSVGAQQAGKLDTTTFVVIGEGLAAGMADFALRDVYQKNSFPAQMAQQFGTAFPQPLIEPPGIGAIPGLRQMPVSIPATGQTTVRSVFPPSLFVFNLAVPGHRLSDALNLRPKPPLVQAADLKQSTTNMLIGMPSLVLSSDKPLWTQVEYAVAMQPTLILVELGYAEAVEAAVRGDSTLLPDPNAFRADYDKLLSALRPTYAQIITTTIPDPTDTAYFSTLAAAADLIGTTADALASRYGLKTGDLLSPDALSAIGTGAAALPDGSVTSAATAADLRAKVRALNSQISSASQQGGTLLYDLNGLFARVRSSGLTAGNRRLTADFLSGFYTLSGLYPGTVGHAAIANDILALLNKSFGTSFTPVDTAKMAGTDPAIRFQATGFGGGAR